MYDEGVIKFQVQHTSRRLSSDNIAALVSVLEAWRRLFRQTGLLGQDPARYGGAGFGNLSCRVGAPSSARGSRSFLITGTQTGHLEQLGLAEYCVVHRYEYRKNQVESEGQILPSSEAMTHGAIYDLVPSIRAVFHTHTPVIWKHARLLGLPRTADSIAYGTPEMATEVQRLYQSTTLSETRVLVMGGHEDGVISFGRNPEEAGESMLRALVKAYQYGC